VTDLRKYSVVLLSAGVGRRLGKLGTSCPKCLLKVNNTTLIEKIILNLQKKKVNEISIILGYKSKMIIDKLKKYKKIKFNFIKITNYKKNGHGCSWHAFKDVWSKNRLPIILMHTDIFFDPKYLDNIIKNKQKNIIGIHSNKSLYKKKSFLVKTTNNNKIININYKNKILSPVGEIIGINKISSVTAGNIFAFMDKFLVKNNKRLSWEIVLDKYINASRDSLFVLKNQLFFWRNINFESDLLYIKKMR
jgi:choline kinase